MSTEVSVPQSPPPIAPGLPRALAQDLYSDEGLALHFRFMRRDYCRIICRTASMPNEARMEHLRQRLAAYSDAMAVALGDAAEDADRLLKEARGRGVWR